MAHENGVLLEMSILPMVIDQELFESLFFNLRVSETFYIMLMRVTSIAKVRNNDPIGLWASSEDGRRR